MASSEKGIDVAHIAALARLKLTDEAAAKLEKEMGSIVTYVEMLSELNVEGIEPTAHAAPMTNVLREDQAVPGFPRDVMLKNAPGTIDDELVAMPQVLPGGGMA